MYKKILIALALDQGYGKRAVELARRLGSGDVEIIAAHVIDHVPAFSRVYAGDIDKDEIAETAKESIMSRVGDIGDIQPVVLEGHAGRTVTDYANKIGADCIICGAHHPGLSDFFLGSTAARIMRYAKCSVHILRLSES
ncbi:MAG: universal stress protein [Gammaproteobacteria bacterium]|nr:universal stress protein [Gammaproteobacteria bacterium]